MRMTRLQPGQQAPDFTVTDVTGTRVSLHDYAGKKLMLCFYRYAACPFCNLSLSKLIAHWGRLSSLGLHVLAFFQSPAETLLKYPARQEPPFPLIADPNRVVYDLYQIESSVGEAARAFVKNLRSYYQATVRRGFKQGTISGNLFLMPADFLIGPPGLTVHRANYWRDFSSQTPFIEIEEFLTFQE